MANGRDPRDEVDTLRDRIEAGDRGGSEADREVLIEFSDQLDLLGSQYSDYRHLKLLRHCCRIAEEVGGLADSLEDRDAAEDIVRWIHTNYDNEETNRDYRSAIRVFGKRATRSDEPPESIAWVPTGTSSNYDPMPAEANMLDWEDDVLPMIDECRNHRDAACIALQFEAGLRGGELQDLTLGSIFDGEHAMGVTVDGKTGRRAVHLVVSVPYLQRWLDDHPGGAPDDPLWSTLREPSAQSYPSYLSNFKVPAERAGVEKPVTPTNFRKSNTRWLVLQGMSQARIEDRQGRARGSNHTARYMARFGEESNERAYAQMHGAEIEAEETADLSPVTCPRCGEETPREADYCMHCHQALDLESKQLLEEVKSRIDDELVAADDTETRSDFVEARRTLEAKPNVLGKEELHDFLTSLSSGSSESADSDD